MTDETTSEQLAEIEGQPEPVQVREGRWRTRGGDIRNVTPTPEGDGRKDRYPWWDAQWLGTWTANGRYYSDREESSLDLVEYLGPIEQDKTQELPEYTPPDGWRVVRFGEQLLPGDVWVSQDGTEQRSDILHWDAAAVSGGRCIRRIKPEPQAQPQPRSAEYTPPEGWRALAVGEVLQAGDVTVRADGYQYSTERVGSVVGANQRYIRPIEPQPQPQPDAATIEELRSEVSYVQNLLGESRQRVTQLEELVGSLRTINRGCENAVRDAGKENFALKNQLEAVKAELAQVSKDRYALQIERDAAQQVPADSPELRQLRADLAEVTRERDQHLDSYQRIFGDLETIRETTKAAAVEAIAEWLQAFRGCNSPSLALLLLEALPSIMRSLTGLADDEDVD